MPLRKILSIPLFLITLFVVFLPENTQATHLIGGNIGYDDLGQDPFNPNNRRYRIYFNAYMDCNSPLWGGAFPEPVIEIGIYEGVLSPSGPILVSDSLDLFLFDSNFVDPNLPPNCGTSLNIISNACTYLLEYSRVISLPNTNLGYHIVYERCCRPGNILNLLNSGDQGFAYLTWIPGGPGGLIPNSSPTFNDTLVSYICRNDTGYVPNAATDADGDSLVYSLEEPFKGVLGDGTGGNPPPQADYGGIFLNPYTINPPVVDWAVGYSGTQLFGPTGYQNINSSNGTTRFMSTVAGFFVASVEIREFRNGQQIGVIRRNIQLIVDDCPNNNSPAQDVSNLDTLALNPTTYLVEEGQNFCFDLDYQDNDGDTLHIAASGDVFNGGITNPPATINFPNFGIGSIDAQFCWNTSCSQGQTTPYTFNVTVTDVACPPLSVVQQINVIVQPFEGPNSINGSALVCANQSTEVYSVTPISGASYAWTVTGGTIVSGNNSASITVDWGSSTSGNVSLITTSQYGCTDGPVDLAVTISPVTADAGNDMSICNINDTVQIGGSPTTAAGNSVVWTPNTNISDVNAFNPLVSPTSTTTYVVSVTDNQGCTATDSVVVSVHPILPSGLDDNYYVCIGDSLEITAINGIAYSWSPTTGISNPNIANPLFFGPMSQNYFLEYTDLNGCVRYDTIFVQVGPDVPTEAGDPQSICLGDTVQLGGNPTSPPFTTYLWNNTTSLNDPTSANPLAFPTATTTYIVTTNNDTCTGVDSVTVTVLPAPTLTVSSDTTICIGDTSVIEATGTGSFSWNNASTLTDPLISNPGAFPSSNTTYVVTITDPNGCTNSDSVNVNIQIHPIADAGDTVRGCFLTGVQIGGTPTGPTGATYSWSPSGSLDDPSIANPTVTIDTSSTFVVEVTDTIGCVSYDTTLVQIFYLEINADTTVCVGDNAQINAVPLLGTGPYIFDWSPTTGLSDSTIGNPLANPDETTTYTLIVSDANSCTDTVDFTVSIRERAESNFQVEFFPSCEGLFAQFENQSQRADFYSWLFESAQFSTAENPDFIFPYGQTLDITLIASTQVGCADSTTLTVDAQTFTEIFDLTIPNVFSPNGDGVNDFFEIGINHKLSECTAVKIFNRWGTIMYQSEGGIHNWDGRTFHGQEAQEGTYFYIFDINGQLFKGTFELMRNN